MARTPPRSPAGDGRRHDDHARLIELERTVEAQQRELTVQLLRIAQLQADIDAMRQAKPTRS
jgi:hypothetical protein